MIPETPANSSETLRQPTAGKYVTPCDFCGGRPATACARLEADGQDTEITLYECAACRDTFLHGTDLQKAAGLLRFVEREARAGNKEALATTARAGMGRNARRRLKRQLEADIPADLERFIQTAPVPFMEALRAKVRP